MLFSGEGDDEKLNSLFYVVEIYAGQGFQITDGLLMARPYFVIQVDQKDFVIFKDAQPIDISLDGSDDTFLSQFASLDEIFQFGRRTNDDRTISLLPSKLLKPIPFPVKRVESQIVLSFGEYARVELPVYIAVQ